MLAARKFAFLANVRFPGRWLLLQVLSAVDENKCRFKETSQTSSAVAADPLWCPDRQSWQPAVPEAGGAGLQVR